VTEVVLEWGLNGARALAERCSVVVVVDVLSFTTAVTVAVERDITVWPHTGGEAAHQLARQIGAHLAGNRGTHAEGPTLSPVSLLALEKGSRLVLPSPNGSTISHGAVTSEVEIVAGSLRNASAVARYLRGRDRVGIVPAGERWSDGSLRPAYEDWVGAGAVVVRLAGHDPSIRVAPEAAAAAAAFEVLRPLRECASGVELVEKGFAEDVAMAEEVDASMVVPVLRDGRYVGA
jgi:2-phosphosulfolactate phosphatase